MNTCLIVLTDSLYLPGTRKTVETFFQHNEEVPLIALSDDPKALEDPWLVSRSEQLVEIDKNAYLTINPYKKRRSQRHARTFYKFEAFGDFGYSRNLFLDSDILCLAPTPLLFENSKSPLIAALDTGFRPTRSYKGSPHEINTGVLSIGRSLMGTATIDQLKTLARDKPGRGGYNSGDQGIINKWIRKHSIGIDLLPQEYNTIKKDYLDKTGLDSCKLLHFADRKPWFASKKEHLPLEEFWHHSEAH